MTADPHAAHETDVLFERYRSLATTFLTGDAEEALFRASELARDCLRAELGPHRLTALHYAVIEALERAPLGEAGPSANTSPTPLGVRLRPLLLEGMVVYGEAHREVHALLASLRASQDELRRRTDELVQAEKLAALGELSASVVHEINQPLNAVMLICKDVSRDYERQRLDLATLDESLRSIIGEIRRVSQIVDQLRVFSRNTAGTRRERIDARSVIQKTLRLLAQQIAVAGVELERTDFPDEDSPAAPGTLDALYVYGDATQLQQVVINLVNNARDAVQTDTHVGAKRIALRGRCEVRGDPGRPREPQPRWVIIEVSDTGPGIPPDRRERIFEPFYTSKGPAKGTGLGLSVTKRIVEEHGGHIEVDSVADEGTTFRVALPYCQEGSVY